MSKIKKDLPVSCILLCAGSGSRMKLDHNKVFLPIGMQNVLQWSLLHLSNMNRLEEIVIVAAPNEKGQVAESCAGVPLPGDLLVTIVTGGATRQESVSIGLEAVTKKGIVLVHDGARPVASVDLFNNVAIAAEKVGAATVAVRTKDTVKKVVNGVSQKTIARDTLWSIQTPQGFRYKLLKKAHKKALETGFIGTDDTSLVERLGKPVSIVEGDYRNIKLTTPEDYEVIKTYLQAEHKPVKTHLRVGYGYDIHRFKEGRPCILGGVLIPSPIGPDGHSDADVLLHALMDALLGAAGLRDIGYYFPPHDERFKDASSVSLLTIVLNLLQEYNMEPFNMDIMVIAEVPKINPYIDEMKSIISKVCGVGENRISIKATTNETLGALGRAEGIAAQAVVTVMEREEVNI